jgi:hypothetical protein
MHHVSVVRTDHQLSWNTYLEHKYVYEWILENLRAHEIYNKIIKFKYQYLHNFEDFTDMRAIFLSGNYLRDRFLKYWQIFKQYPVKNAFHTQFLITLIPYLQTIYSACKYVIKYSPSVIEKVNLYSLHM